VRRPALLLALLLAAAPATAAVSIDAQTRNAAFSSLRTHQELFCTSPQSCSLISQTLTPDSGSQAASSFAPFIAHLTSSVFPNAVDVSQSSWISPAHLSARASHAATGAASLGSGGPGILIQDYTTHQTSSLFRVDFHVDEATSYRLTGTIAASGAGFIGDTSVHVELRRATGEVLHRIALQDDDNCLDPSCTVLGPLSLDESGSLPAGSYVLEAELQGQTGVLITSQVQVANSHTGSFDVDLRLGVQVPLLPAAPAALLPAGCIAWVAARRLRRTREDA
jgi:hypothetical protein